MTHVVRSHKLAVSLIITACEFAARRYAQFSSGYTGVVVEQTQAAVPGAKIIATNQATGVSQFTVSSAQGDFHISSLPGGIYTIEVDASGFRQWVQKDVQLESNQVKTLYPSLALPTQTASIEVTGAVATIETDKSNTSREI